MASNRSLRVEDAAESKDVVLSVLDNLPGTALEVASSMYAPSIRSTSPIVPGRSGGRRRAGRETAASGAARAKLDEFARFTQGCAA